MSIASRITEIETHIGNAYTSIDNLGIDISNTNKNIYNISTLLDTFYESLPKVSGIGSNLSLSPSMVGKIKLNEIQGDTLQNGTPTPSSPVPIQSVTGLQNVEVCGKNIFNGEIRQGNQNYTTTSARLFSNKNDWYFTSGTKLTFSTDLPNTFKVCFYLAKKPYLSEQYTAMQSFSYFSNGEQSITLTADGYLGFTIAKNDETAIIPSDVANYHFQIEYGETKSSYKQYNGNTYEVNLGNIELNKIGDYEDYIFKNEPNNPLYDDTLTLNSWYITKNIGKVVLNGSESWSEDTGATNPFYIANVSSKIIAPSTSGYGTSLCNIYKNASIYAATTETGFILLSNGTTLTNCRIRETQMGDLSGFKNRLSQNNAIIYSPLVTPKYTTITNTELIEQLEALNNAKSKDGTTNINVTSEDLSMILNVGVLKGE